MMDNKRAIELLGDLIGFEEELIDIKNEYNIPWYVEDINASDYDEALKIAIKTLEEKPKTGRWLSHKEYCEKHDLIPSGLVTLEWCSNCDFGIDINELHGERYNYCPMCGAKMEV